MVSCCEGIAHSATQMFERAIPLMYIFQTCKHRGGVNCELEIATTHWNCHRTFSCQKTTARSFTPSHNKIRLSPIGYLQYLLSNHWIFNLFISISVHISYLSAAKIYRNVTFLHGYGHGWSTSPTIWPQII